MIRTLVPVLLVLLAGAPSSASQELGSTDPRAERIRFRRATEVSLPNPTAAAWGPDGRLYVASLDGRVTALGFAADWSLTESTTYAGISALPNHEVLGVAFDPYAPGTVLYIAHGDLFGDDVTPPGDPSPYTGAVSKLGPPLFDTPLPVVTGLPTSHTFHGVDAIQFDNDGDLLIGVGGNTNAGVRSAPMGALPESPLSGAILRARLSEPSFQGAVTYVETLGGLPSDDQLFGDLVDVNGSVGVDVFASGLRNPFGLAFSTRGRLYATDSGTQAGLGRVSTGPQSSGPSFTEGDELLLVERGNYYGHPNRNRGRSDSRQNLYRPSSAGGSLPETFTQTIASLSRGAFGVVEYRSDAFDGRLRGDLVVKRHLGGLQRVRLSADGRRSLGVARLSGPSSAVGLVAGVGGALIELDLPGNLVRVLVPRARGRGLAIHDITPWRAPATGGRTFVLGGTGFGTLADTQVTLGGTPATLLEVSPNRIVGRVPARANPTTELLDVTVTVGGDSALHAAGFRYLLGRGLEPARWEPLSDAPVALGEVATGIVDGVLYVVGEGGPETLAFDLLAETWLPSGAARPFLGHHHAAEGLGGKLYLIGGLEGGSEGKLQIYDPGSDAWSLGADLPWAGGSVSSAVIDGRIYAASGIVSTWTVNNLAVYAPELDAWTPLAPIPSGRNHAAAGTDGEQLYIFGGRRGGNFTANGYDQVLVYDPAANAWDWSDAPGSALVPLPEARGGTGRAVFVDGEFYVFGGETKDDPDADPATRVYDRVDVYDPVAHSWRSETPMRTPRHGTQPIVFQSQILIPCGGTVTGWSFETVLDRFVLP